MFFEQDEIASHTSKKIKNLLEKLFGDNLIQNAPHSPDRAYPIELYGLNWKKELKKEEQKI